MMTEQPLSEHFSEHAGDLTLSRGGELPEGIQVKNDGLLSLKDIEVRLDANYSRLQRLANAPGIGEHLGAVKVPGAKGVRYEPRALGVFRRLLAASDANAVTPATATAWLEANREASLSASREAVPIEPAETAIIEKLVSGHSADLTTRGLAAIFSPMVSVLQEVRDLLHDFRTGRAQIAPPALPAPDRLLTAEQAAELLACHPRTVSRYVKSVRPHTWRESDCLRYIERLGEALPAAESEAAK